MYVTYIYIYIKPHLSLSLYIYIYICIGGIGSCGREVSSSACLSLQMGHAVQRISDRLLLLLFIAILLLFILVLLSIVWPRGTDRSRGPGHSANQERVYIYIYIYTVCHMCIYKCIYVHVCVYVCVYLPERVLGAGWR